MADDYEKIDEELLQQAVDGLDVCDGRASDALDQLRQIGHDSLFYRSGKAGEPWSKTQSELEQIKKAADALLEHLGGTNSLDDLKRAMSKSPAVAIAAFQFAEIINSGRRKHFPLDDEATRQRLASFLRALESFKRAAEAGLENVSEKVAPERGGRRHEVDWARRETSWHVLRLYFELTKRRPGVSKTEGAPPSGPAVRFLDACLRAYGWNTTPSTAANIIDELKKDPEAPWNTTSKNQT